jgi:nucleoid-associated protein YgaU
MADFAPITIHHPLAHDIVDAPVHVCGIGTAFEGTLTARLRDAGGQVLVQENFQAGGTGVWANFSLDLPLGVPQTFTGSLEVFEESQAGNGAELFKKVVPVIFGSALANPAHYFGFLEHIVVGGDTLGKLAATFYGDASRFPVIFAANSDQLTDPNKISVGQKLRIPQFF